MLQKKVFQSSISFQDAAQQALSAGYTPSGQAQNKSGWFIIFAYRRDEQQQQKVFNSDWLKGRL